MSEKGGWEEGGFFVFLLFARVTSNWMGNRGGGSSSTVSRIKRRKCEKLFGFFIKKFEALRLVNFRHRCPLLPLPPPSSPLAP